MESSDSFAFPNLKKKKKHKNKGRGEVLATSQLKEKQYQQKLLVPSLLWTTPQHTSSWFSFALQQHTKPCVDSLLNYCCLKLELPLMHVHSTWLNPQSPEISIFRSGTVSFQPFPPYSKATFLRTSQPREKLAGNGN